VFPLASQGGHLGLSESIIESEMIDYYWLESINEERQMAIWHRESGSRAASRDGLGAVFQQLLQLFLIVKPFLRF